MSEGTRENGKLLVSAMYEQKDQDGTARKTRPDHTEEHMIEVAPFADAVVPARVRCALGLTINLGNFESARVDASIELPCYAEEQQQAFARAWALVEAELREQAMGTPAGTKTTEKFDRKRGR